MGKMMEQGPVLIITFQTQQIMVVRDSKGAVVEGDPVSFFSLISGYLILFFSLSLSGKG